MHDDGKRSAMSYEKTSLTTNLDSSNQGYSSGAVGVTVFAGVLMIMVGVFHAIQGLVALFNDEFCVLGQEYIFQFDVTAWGWIHLLLGVVVALAGAALFRGALGLDRSRGRGGCQHGVEFFALAAPSPRVEHPHHRPRRLRHLGGDPSTVATSSTSDRRPSPPRPETRRPPVTMTSESADSATERLPRTDRTSSCSSSRLTG